MLTAMLTVDNIATGARHDVWTVNVEEDYHETVSATDEATVYPGSGSSASTPSPTAASRTGRDAPILPRREREENAA